MLIAVEILDSFNFVLLHIFYDVIPLFLEV